MGSNNSIPDIFMTPSGESEGALSPALRSISYALKSEKVRKGLVRPDQQVDGVNAIVAPG